MTESGNEAQAGGRIRQTHIVVAKWTRPVVKRRACVGILLENHKIGLVISYKLVLKSVLVSYELAFPEIYIAVSGLDCQPSSKHEEKLVILPVGGPYKFAFHLYQFDTQVVDDPGDPWTPIFAK